MGNKFKRTITRDYGRDFRPGNRRNNRHECIPGRKDGSDPERNRIPYSERSFADSLCTSERSNGDEHEQGPDRADGEGHASIEGISQRPEVEIDGEYGDAQDLPWRSHNFSIRAKSSEPRGAFMPIGSTR